MATVVVVIGGGFMTLGVAQASAATTGSISGTVTAASGGADLGGICVNAQPAGYLGPEVPGPGTTTAADGTYTISGLATGSYGVQFITGCGANSGNYVTQWYNNETSSGSANPVAVTVGSTTPSINAAMQPGGTITGTVTAAVGGAALGGICVGATLRSGGTPRYGFATTASDGTYSDTGLAAGSYYVEFSAARCTTYSGPSYVTQDYNNETWATSSDPVSVTVGSTTPSINAAMQPGGTITGTVTAAVGGAAPAGICVYASQSGGGPGYGFGITASNGTYSVTGLPAGSYIVQFYTGYIPGAVQTACGNSGNYVTQWYNNETSSGSANLVSVTIGSTTASIDAAMQPATTAPGAPTGLGATPGNTTATLSWTAPSSNGGSTITGYDVYEGTTPGGESSTPVNGTTLIGATSYTVTGLTNGTTYYFRVRALNGASTSSNASSEVSATPTPTPTPTPTTGYWEVATDGGIFSFGDAGFYGSMGGTHLNKPIVGTAAAPDGKGYWEVASDGGIFSFGDAGFFGSQGGTALNQPIVGMATTPDGKGYWLVASDGGIFSFGDATFYGSTGAMTLNKPIVGMATTLDGKGYWLVASDGGIFSFGDAKFYGSTGGTHLNQPIVGMTYDSATGGYWEVASDGGIFSFNAPFQGSMGGTHLNQPIVGMAFDSATGGYWEVASDGGIFSFNAPFLGSMGGTHLNQPIVSMEAGGANPS